MVQISNLLEKQLDSVGGRLEWVSDIGLGLSFAPETTVDVIEGLQETILKSVWINFDETQITDRTLALLERSPVLESLSLKSTRMTVEGLRRFLRAVPTLAQLDLSAGVFGSDEMDALRAAFPRVVIRGR
ncbi:MAG: hypothetical protein U0903_03275 [Planctomycetales bacterium]